MDENGQGCSDKRTYQHVPEEMLSQVDPGIPYRNGPEEVADIPFLVFLEQGQQGREGKYRSGMSGGKTAKTGKGDHVDEIGILAGSKEFFRAGHREKIL